MPEGPVILLMKEHLQKFVGEKVVAVSGSEIEESLIKGKTLKEIKLYGKQTYLIFDEINIRIHLLMFGSYELNQSTQPEKNLRLGLSFKNGKAFFYTCSVKIISDEFLKTIDWKADVMSKDWNPEKAKSKLKTNPKMMICDALMDQDIFSGVGNIIKNETLFRTGIQPENLIENIPSKKLDALISEARNFSFDFYNWKRDGVLRKKFQVYEQKNCPICEEALTKKMTGKSKRTSFYCETHQKLF
jgi:endonuclease-8